MDTAPLTTTTRPSTAGLHQNIVAADTNPDRGIGVGLDSESGAEERGELDESFRREGELARLMTMRRIVGEEPAAGCIASIVNLVGPPNCVRLSNMFNNYSESDRERYFYNVANVFLRQVLSVSFATYARQLLAYVIEWELGKHQIAVRMGIAASAALYPVVLNVAGLVRDRYYEEDTTSSNLCRFINIGAGFTAVGVAAYRGVLPDLAPSLVAYNVFCVIRDLMQTYVRLQNGIYEFALIPTFRSAVFYGVNQIVVNFLMQLFASPSGDSAVNLPYDRVVMNDIFRSLINVAGETVDLLTMAGLQHVWNGGNLTIKLETDNPPFKQLIKVMTGTYTARSSLLINLLLVNAIILSFFNLDHLPSFFLQDFIKALVPALIVVFGYVIFMGIATRANFGYSSDAQTEGQLIR